MPSAPKHTVTPTPVRADSQPLQVSQKPQPLAVRRNLFPTSALEAEDGQEEIDLEPSLSENDSDVIVSGHGDNNGYVSAVPSVNDTRAEKPKQGVLHISRSAINSRMRRIMAPNSKGQFKVSKAILDDWNAPRGSKKKHQLEQIFQMCGYDPATQA